MVAVNFVLCAVLLGADPAVDTKPEVQFQPAVQAVVQPAAQPEAQPAAQPAAKPADLELIAIEKNIVDYTNAERAKRGLPALKVDKSLMTTARNHASWMARTRNMIHTTLAVAENIAMGQRDSSEAVHSWMNSSGHRANILNPSHGKIGVAAYRTQSGTIFWCQQFRR